MNNKEECIFCKIAKKEISAQVIYENEYVIAFNDLNPAANIHLLIIPKKHFDSLLSVDNKETEIVVKIHLAVTHLARMLNVEKSGFRIISNCGKNAGQTVYHLHYHFLAGEKL